jgi:hypothetical protein
MNDARRARLRVLARMLETVEEEARAVWREEEERFDDRSTPSKHSGLGETSREAVQLLEKTCDAIGHAKDLILTAAGDPI